MKVVFHVDTLFVEDKSAAWRLNQARENLQHERERIERMERQKKGGDVWAVLELFSSDDVLSEMCYRLTEEIDDYPDAFPPESKLDAMPLFQLRYEQLEESLPELAKQKDDGFPMMLLICDYAGALVDCVSAVKCVMREGVNRVGVEFSFRSVMQAMRDWAITVNGTTFHCVEDDDDSDEDL